MDRQEKTGKPITISNESDSVDYETVKELKKNSGIKMEYLKECEKVHKKINLSKKQETKNRNFIS